MKYYEVKHINDFLIDAAYDLLNSQISSPRNLKTLEIEDATMCLLNPKNNIITVPERKLNLDYLKAELEWYKSGDLNPDKIKEYAKMWDNIRNPDGTINSNYGHFVFKQQINGISQFEWCENVLKKDIDSRQAIINYNQPMHKFKENKDFVCTIAQQFRIKDNKLDSRVVMRSNDLIYGFSYDVPWFTYVQEELANKLQIESGRYIHHAWSLHVYERHFDMLRQIAKHKKLEDICAITGARSCQLKLFN